jgi:hypothetical protein
VDLIDALDIPRSHVVYEVLHFPRPDVPTAQYEQTMRDLHTAIRAHTAAVRAHAAGVLSAAYARSGGADLPPSVRGETAGALWTRETRFELDTRVAGDALRPALERGAEHLARLGLPSGADARVYETCVGLDGAANLDVLEHVMRDRVGIYDGAHGRHVEEHVGFLASARNLIRSLDAPHGRADGYTAIVYMTKPSGTSPDFRDALIAGMQEAAARSGLASQALWERKLGLGVGLDVMLRFSGVERVEQLVEALAAFALPTIAETARQAVARGALVIGRVLG